MKNKKKKIKERNFAAIQAWQRSGAGSHKDETKYDRKRDKSVRESEDE